MTESVTNFPIRKLDDCGIHVEFDYLNFKSADANKYFISKVFLVLTFSKSADCLHFKSQLIVYTLKVI